MDVKLFVEGIADIKFLKDYIAHLYKINLSKDDIIETKGWTNIQSQKTEGEQIRNQMQKNTDNDGINLLIFDADSDFNERLNDLKQWRKKQNLEFEIFLFPNNKDAGDLETLLENIINDKNSGIFECWGSYEECLSSKEIDGRTEPLTIPAKKTKIYGYLEALLGESKSQKKKIKEEFREYTKVEHWNLDADYLRPLKDFISTYYSI